MIKFKIKKETLKTYTLVLLIISSVFLTGKIWLDEKLWPEGYNFFAIITDKFAPKQEPVVSSLTKETIAFPKTLTVTNIEKRSVYAADSEEFATMLPEIKMALRTAMESTVGSSITEQDWAVALRTRSIHVVYPVAYDSGLFLNILGSYQDKPDSAPVREFIITANDVASNTVNVYIRNQATAEITKVPVNMNKQTFDTMVDSYATHSIGNIAYSSELNFDKAATGGQQKVIIDSGVLIQLNKQINNMVEEINPIYSDGEFNPEVVEPLLSQFGCNADSTRKYTEKDNSVLYVENYASVKLHPNGLIEYKSIDNTKGIPLGGTDFYGNLLSCVDFVNHMWGEVYPSIPLNINISSDVIDAGSNSFVLTMDYFADGAQVNIGLPQSTSYQPMNHAVEITVAGGRITSYRQMMIYYESAEQSTDGETTIEALDKLLAENDMQDQIIRDLYPVYISDGSPLLKSAWAVLTANGRTVVIN